MTEDGLVVGVVLVIFGFLLNAVNPYISPSSGTNIGLWGLLFLVLGLIVIGVSLRSIV